MILKKYMFTLPRRRFQSSVSAFWQTCGSVARMAHKGGEPAEGTLPFFAQLPLFCAKVLSFSCWAKLTGIKMRKTSSPLRISSVLCNIWRHCDAVLSAVWQCALLFTGLFQVRCGSDSSAFPKDSFRRPEAVLSRFQRTPFRVRRKSFRAAEGLLFEIGLYFC